MVYKITAKEMNDGIISELSVLYSNGAAVLEEKIHSLIA